MEITAWAAEEQAADRAENGIAQIAMQRRHGAWCDAAQETITHHELISGPQFLHEAIQHG